MQDPPSLGVYARPDSVFVDIVNHKIERTSIYERYMTSDNCTYVLAEGGLGSLKSEKENYKARCTPYHSIKTEKEVIITNNDVNFLERDRPTL